MRTNITVSNRPKVITIDAERVTTLSGLSDVNFNNALSGAVLQYDAATKTWIAENVLERPGLTLDCGIF
jgi:hypothetical protein